MNTISKQADMVKRLTDATGSDSIVSVLLSEITPNVNNAMQEQLNTLTDMMKNVMATVAGLSQRSAPTGTTPASNNVYTLGNSPAVTPPPGHSTPNLNVTNDNGADTLVNYPNTSTQRNDMVTSGGSACQSVRDVVIILPDFEPVKGNLTAIQFIDKIKRLSEIYGWQENVILYAVQTKLKGLAKEWVDAQQAFRKWSDFVNALLTDFPSSYSSADIHIEMIERHKSRNESMIDFYYSMLALGRRGKLDERSIIQHIINGLYDEHIKKTLRAMNLTQCPQLYTALKGNFVNHSHQPQSSSFQRQKQTAQREPKTNMVKTGEDKEPDQEMGCKAVMCYNCGEAGHISVNCPEPQKKMGCQVCERTSHATVNCPNARTFVLVKRILVNEQPVEAFVDPGSNVISTQCICLHDSINHSV